MPTVHREDGFRYYFYSNESNEPPHVHVDKGGATAKVWLQPVAVAWNLGFNARQLAEIAWLVRTRRRLFLEAWREHFPGPT